jgi:putative ABC transport system permease protein
MSATTMMSASERWLRILFRLFPTDFREEMGDAMLDAYRDRCRSALSRGGRLALAGVWMRALGDAVRNGLGERLSPAVAWRRRGNWGRDAERAWRRIVRAPAFTLAMLGTLSVGLGAFAVVYTVVDRVLLAPLPYERPGDLYFVWRDLSAIVDMKRGWVAGPDVAALDSIGGPIAGAAALRRDLRTLSAAAVQDGEPEEIPVMISTPNLFTLLGVRPQLGRAFLPEEVGEGRPGVVVLGWGLWQRRFGGDPGVIGREVRLDTHPFRVIGVMGRDFRFARHSSLGAPETADAYITFGYDVAAMPPTSGAFAALVRARPGAAPPAVASAVDAVGRAIDQRSFRGRGLRLYATGLRDDLLSPVKPALLVLAASGVFLLLVLGVNLATLLLARAMQREREFAVSRALGADRGALVRATLLEAGALGAFGAMGATLLAFWATRALVTLAPLDLPRRDTIAVDWRIAAVVLATGTMMGLLAGAAPAFWASRTSLATLLRNAAVRGGGRGRLRRALVVAQVGLCLVLLSAGGLVARSFERLLRSEPGFEPAGALTLRVPITPAIYPTNAEAVAFHARVQRELAAIPGVTAVGAASALPLTAGTDQWDAVLPGAPGNTGQPEHDKSLVDVISARPGWFTALGIHLIGGRDFEPARPGSPREVVIDRTLAEKFYAGANALGAPIHLSGGTPHTIVGIVDHARQYDLHQDGRPQVYIRDEDDTYGTLYFALRTRREPADVAAEARGAVRRVDPQVAVSEVRPLERIVDESLREQRASAVMIGGFSIGALLLAAMGLFGVVAASVVSRRHEVAVRLALGADHRRALGLVLRDGAILVALGILIGAPGVYFAGRLLRGVLLGISPFDPLTLAVVSAGLALVALASCWLPARRVTRIDPAHVLREH